MTLSQPILVGVFKDRAMAEHAIDGLHNAGVSNSQISYSGPVTSGGFFEELKSMFTGEETSTPGDVVRDLKKMGVPTNEAEFYANEHKAGRLILAVNANGHVQEIANILRSNGGYTYAQAAGYGQGTATPTRDADQRIAGDKERIESNETRSVPVREEQLRVEKQPMQTGEARIHKEVVSEQRTINVPVNREELVVERRAVPGEPVSDTPIGQDETIRVPLSEEQVTVTKQPVVTGEVEIGKRTVQDQEQFTDTVKREEVYVEPSDEEVARRVREGKQPDRNIRREYRDRQRGKDDHPLP
ncbi:MAG TPA: YsnF/AvaK domain-containing protein [Ktedonobacteraceae bacterium]|nr:YsnF/AvaK domain-containing protein [Ktedonobacteraceae bacterium]